MKKTCERIREMTTAVMKEAKLEGDEPLSGLGLCLSGCEDEQSNKKLKQMLSQIVTNVDHIEIASDTKGPLAAASDAG